MGQSQLFDILDIGNEFPLVAVICNKLNFSTGDILDIRLATAGGGNSANAWLEDFKANHGNVQIKDFEKALNSNNVAFPTHLREISFVSGLSHSNIKVKSELLLPSDAWRSVAENFGYSIIQIEKFHRVQMHPNNYSPARTLFHKINQMHPNLTVEDFMAILHENEIMNAFNHMAEKVKSWAETKVSDSIN